MKIIAIQQVDDCIETSLTREILFDTALTPETIEHLGKYGELEFFKTFSRPFFRVLIDNRIHIKGIEGNESCVVILDHDDCEGSLNKIITIFNDIGSQYTFFQNSPLSVK